MSKISAIVPVLNEADRIIATLERVRSGHEVEIIAIDGGSTDGTLELLAEQGISAIATSPGRGHQMNCGAEQATGEYLLFLHGDTLLPWGYDRAIRQILQQPGVIAGAFALGIEGRSWQYRMVEWGVRWRSRLCQLPYGDQGIFLSRQAFEAVGGFPEVPILEDRDLIQRLKRRGKIAIASLPVLTSARRWQKLGVWRTMATNQAVLLADILGGDRDRLARWYRQQK
ncbi:TIGR04283 family arsenosugar biosynthesis glycosyltransferase [Roseofilum casamattae]|uniref:4,4'-diaponeurosporenoate glycosyltransferase n=1 Tax=Roseofilum casamattae BLCC-M143 TaxID=3022442 RepID=A0ABT7BTY9_9CYAN|nr:TIGR04283 family arsenosugar biosynthesis glycosyltransferase [Roseofilum casamattae]MDJ1182654.1 TIGR04283 family arsenosugar biosynthesis glycosyltransferase [Roseofilum casamattae BLCC-M143]